MDREPVGRGNKNGHWRFHSQSKVPLEWGSREGRKQEAHKEELLLNLGSNFKRLEIV